VVRPDAPLLTAFDLGVTRGDGCFDTCRVVVEARGKRVDHFEAHLARFSNSAKALGLGPIDLDAWRQLVGQAISAWTLPGEALLKLNLTRGPEYGLRTGPTAFVTIVPMPDAASRLRRGMTAVTLNRAYLSLGFTDSPWLLGGVKTLSYAINMAARREANRRGSDDAIFLSADGCLLEGTTAGLIFAMDDKLWTTPTENSGVLRSITVEAILHEAEREGISVSRAFFTLADLTRLQGLWFASATGVKPVLRVDDTNLPHEPALTHKLAECGGFELG
jgi:4-amino-4-deoxychorismate lyase